MDVRGIHLVRVTTQYGEHRMWAEATARNEAIDRVLEFAPAHCSARLMDERLKPRKAAIANKKPGEVRDLSR